MVSIAMQEQYWKPGQFQAGRLDIVSGDPRPATVEIWTKPDAEGGHGARTRRRAVGRDSMGEMLERGKTGKAAVLCHTSKLRQRSEADLGFDFHKVQIAQNARNR
jgi:hypothetical protein